MEGMKSSLGISLRSFSGAFTALGMAAGFYATPLFAETIIVAPKADTTVVSSLSSRTDAYFNYGGGTQLFASQYGHYANPGTAGEYGLLRFELPDELSSAQIVSVTLVLTTSQNFGVSTSWAPRLDVYQVDGLNSGWVKGSANGGFGLGASGGYLNNLSTAVPITGTKWASGGLFNQAEGDTAGVIGTANLTPLTGNTAVRVSLDIASVQSWLTNSDLAEAGIAVHLNTTYTGGASWMTFHSSRAATEEYRPYLEIEYQAIPEPKALGLMALPLLYILIKKGRQLQRG